MATLRQLAEKAVDQKCSKSAGRLVDCLRSRGFTYNCVVQFVQRIRPAVTDADWETLLYESDMESGEG